MEVDEKKLDKLLNAFGHNCDYLYQEVYKKNFRMRGVNQYAFADDSGNVIQYAHGGFDKNLNKVD